MSILARDRATSIGSFTIPQPVSVRDRHTTVRGPLRPPRRERPSGRHPAWTNKYLALHVVMDAAIGGAAVAVARQFAAGTQSLPAWIIVLGCIIWPAAVAVSRGYLRSRFGVGSEMFRSVFAAMIKVVVVVAFWEAFTQTGALLSLIGVAAPVAVAASLVGRGLSRSALHRRQASGKMMRDVIAVGHLDDVIALHETLRAEPQAGLRMVGACLPRTEHEDAIKSDIAVFGDLDEVAQASAAHNVHTVAVTNRVPSNYLRQLSWALEGEPVDLLVHPGLMEVAGPRMHIRPHVGLPLLAIEQPHFFGWRRVLKRAFDLAATLTGLLLISPLLLLIALVVKLGDRGSVFFRQTRIGINGQPFEMIKFRTMVPNAEELKAKLMEQNEGSGPLFKMQSDPRITRVGGFLRRFSLDELPQLLNVVKGEMSLVGPRPPLKNEVEHYASSTHRRLLVTPGLTGLWQVSGRSLLTWEESVRLDLRYVENWSLSLDLMILWKTLGAVVGKNGAF